MKNIMPRVNESEVTHANLRLHGGKGAVYILK